MKMHFSIIWSQGTVPQTVESVLRSRLETPTGAVPGALNMSSILSSFGGQMTRRSMAFHVHHTPKVTAACHNPMPIQYSADADPILIQC